jgi:uncharacterized protein (TIGR01777 family)
MMCAVPTAMNVTITGATGRLGRAIVAALRERGDAVTALSRSPDRARAQLGTDAVAWDPAAGPAPKEALSGRDAVIHLAGEDVGQRWTPKVKERIRASRETGTRNLVEGLRAADPRPRVLVSASASGYYGARGDERVDETSQAGDDFLAEVVKAWEREALAATELGVRVVTIRTGIVLDAEGGALARMLPPFKAGVGGPVAGGRQYLPWIHLDDVVGMYLAAVDGEEWSGAINASAPTPVTNRDFSKALGRALHRPAIAPVPKLAMQALFGEMSQIVTGGVNMVPERATELGYRYRHPELDEALSSALR